MTFLKSQTTYQLHLQPPRGKKVTPVITRRPLQLVQCDLIDMSDLPYHYNTLQTNNGTEFLNSSVKKVLEDVGIKHITGPTYAPQAQGQIERTNGMKRLLYANMTAKDTKVWLDLLPACVSNYNNTLHTTIKTTPTALLNSDWRGQNVAAKNIKQAAKSVLNNNKRLTGELIKVGDHVRVTVLHECDRFRLDL